MSLLSVENLSVRLPPGGDRSHAVKDVSFTLDRGEILCIVGESGSGKSISAAAIMGLLPPALAGLTEVASCLKARTSRTSRRTGCEPSEAPGSA